MLISEIDKKDDKFFESVFPKINKFAIGKIECKNFF